MLAREASVVLQGVDHAVISRHLRDLENALGVALRDRSIGSLTPKGHEYHARIAPCWTGWPGPRRICAARCHSLP
ncbi:LysR family transcriptional regulator [Komagataeibacter xylinus]|uniref:helix-turn-helix domain-containing protein n=1 Tax=Komagataeibacter xylinus TaxID=28448 RepID=UPI001F0D223A|nr:LysR family transcriptional regulator [Komagataeibacter xylinus]